jgi:hypothetical protein
MTRRIAYTAPEFQLRRLAMTHRLFLVAVLAAAGIVGTAHADIYKCVDPSGHVTYTNQKTADKGCSLLSKDQAVSTVPASKPAAKAATPSPAGFPKVDGDTQKKRDGDRRTILETELETEQKNLEQAKKELTEQESVRLGDEKNYQKMIDRLQPYKDKVALHERNVEALKKEIANLK